MCLPGRGRDTGAGGSVRKVLWRGRGRARLGGACQRLAGCRLGGSWELWRHLVRCDRCSVHTGGPLTHPRNRQPAPREGALLPGGQGCTAPRGRSPPGGQEQGVWGTGAGAAAALFRGSQPGVPGTGQSAGRPVGASQPRAPPGRCSGLFLLLPFPVCRSVTRQE